MAFIVQRASDAVRCSPKRMRRAQYTLFQPNKLNNQTLMTKFPWNNVESLRTEAETHENT